MGVGMKDIITCLEILDLDVGESNIGRHVIKVVDTKIGPIIRDMEYKAIKKIRVWGTIDIGAYNLPIVEVDRRWKETTNTDIKGIQKQVYNI